MSNLFGEPIVEGQQYTVTLSVDIVRQIHKYEYDRSGGWQNHTRATLKRLHGEHGLDLHWDDTYLGQTCRCGWVPSPGTWQKICRSIVSTIRRQREQRDEMP